MDSGGIFALILRYLRLRPFVTLFASFVLGLVLGRLVSAEDRLLAGIGMAAVALGVLWVAVTLSEPLLGLASLLLAAGFVTQALKMQAKEDLAASLLALSVRNRDTVAWRIYLDGKTYQAFRMRGVFVRGILMGIHQNDRFIPLRKSAVWVHFPLCSGRPGFVAIPTSEMECASRETPQASETGSKLTKIQISLPALVTLRGDLEKIPTALLELVSWAKEGYGPTILVTARDLPRKERAREAEQIDARRDQLRRYLKLAHCYDGIREKPICQMFTIFLGRRFVQLDSDLLARFRRTGLVHLVVPSGAQVTFALLLFLYIGQRVRPLRIPMVAVCVGVVAWATGFFGGIPMWRAAGISLLALLGFLLIVEGDFLNQTAAVGLVLLVVRPDWLFDPSFQLSLSASSGMVIGSQLIHGKGLLRNAVRAGAGTLGSQLLLLPALSGFSGTLLPWAALANLVMAPLVSVCLALGYLSFALSVVGWNFPAASVVVLSKPFLWAALKIVFWFSELPIILRQNIQVSPLFFLLFGVVVFVAGEALFLRTRGKWYWASLTTLMVVWMVVPFRVPEAYVYSTGAGGVAYFPIEGLWIGTPYWEEWWHAIDRITVSETETAFFLIYPEKVKPDDVSRIALALTRRYAWLRYLPLECVGRGNRHIGVDFCCYGLDPGCVANPPGKGWAETGVLTAKVRGGKPFLILRMANRLQVVTESGLYCIGTTGSTDCKGSAIGLGDGSLVINGRLYKIRGLWGLRAGFPPTKLPDWWLKGLD